MHWNPNHPYRWRTWLRTHLPWFLIDLGLAKKAADCEKAGAEHWWYNKDADHRACYHCRVICGETQTTDRPTQTLQPAAPGEAVAGTVSDVQKRT